MSPLWSRAMRPRAAIVLLLLAALAALAGCGGGSQDRSDYAKALNKAQNGLAERFRSLQTQITPTSTPAQDAKTLRAYEGAVSTTVADLRAVDPPSGLTALHQRLVGEVADYGTALRAARGRLGSDDPQAVLAAQGHLRTAIAQAGERLNATIRAINDKIKG
jgi:hypothetical protein